MTAVYLRKAKRRNLVVLYKTYFNFLNEDKKSWERAKLEKPHFAPKLNFQRVLMVHVINTLLARFSAVGRTGSILALFQNQWNPLILEVFAEDTLIGCIFLNRQSANVFQIDVISSIKPKQEEWIHCEVFLALKQYIKKLGAKRIIIRSIEENMKQTLQLCGFEPAYYDSVLFIDL